MYALLEAGTSYLNSDADSDRVTRLASTGIRLVIDEFREDVTKTRKDGSKGALRIRYGANDTSAERVWLWKFIEGGKTAGELYGRALVVIAAEHYASRLVVPTSQQHPPLAWSSRQAKAVTALEKLAGPHVPVSLKQQLQKAVVKAKAQYDEQLSQARSGARRARAEADGAEHVDEIADEFDGADEDLEDLDDFED